MNDPEIPERPSPDHDPYFDVSQYEVAWGRTPREALFAAWDVDTIDYAGPDPERLDDLDISGRASDDTTLLIPLTVDEDGQPVIENLALDALVEESLDRRPYETRSYCPRCGAPYLTGSNYPEGCRYCSASLDGEEGYYDADSDPDGDEPGRQT